MAIESFLSTTFCKDFRVQERFVPFPAANISTALILLKRLMLESPGLAKLQGYLNCYISGVSDRELANSTGSKGCSEGNRISFSKWRKKLQQTEKCSSA